MARKRPDDRLDRLLDCATLVFLQRGYQRTQMADIAKALGVAPGTLYLYVESKEALFHLLVERGWQGEVGVSPTLPVPTPLPGATLALLQQRLTDGTRLPKLTAALQSRRVNNVEAELTEVIRELYETVARNHRGIKLLERSALDWPELTTLFYSEMRRNVLARLTQYIERRVAAKHFRAVPDAAAAARFVNESIAWFAMHRHNDRDTTELSDAAAEATVVDLLVNALLRR